MAQEFQFHDPGEGIHEAEILDLYVAEGDRVRDGDSLMSIETDKAAIDLPASFSGTVESLNVAEGDVAQVGDVLLTYREEDEGEPSSGADSGEAAAPQGQETEDADAAPAPPRRHDRPVPAAPATRRLAREQGVDLHAVQGSGPGGRVTPDDVRRAAQGGSEAAPESGVEKPREPAPTAAEGLPDFSQWGEIERQPLRSIRRTIARRMSESWRQAPQVMHADVADITDLERFRQHHKAEVEENGGKLTTTVLVIKAVVAALKEFPRFNASLDPQSGELILKHYFHIGVAVATERGLMVPVVRDADRKSISELAVEMGRLADRARNGEVDREEMRGGTFSVTNPGPLGGTVFTPLVNYPEVAILGVGQARLEPVVEGDLEDYTIVPRLQLPLSFTFDHRVNDGADAARFVSSVIAKLADPDCLLLTA
ncbi:MAG TPA: dihydrolipoamide acetyltransferase family protein [Gammaproteobacteria bacterium]|nr:dihydrolipoamide acetyltransferase family protein [Gammaproteobacteria bacterium]